MTGRRVSEIVRLRRSDLTMEAATITITTIGKGAKVMRDALKGKTAAALAAWMTAMYPAGMPQDAPLFCSLSRHDYGAQLTPRSVSRICQRWLGTSKVHATRHTFAAGMERMGASLTDIQDRLGHSNAATTGRYLHALHDAQNAYADKLESLYGIE